MEYNCKGAHVVQARIWFDERNGEGSFDRLAVTCGLVYKRQPDLNAWYPVQPLVKILQQSGVSLEAATRQVALRNGQRDLNTIYKFFMRIAQPRLVLGFLPLLWKTYISFGDLEVTENVKGTHVGIIRNVPAQYL